VVSIPHSEFCSFGLHFAEGPRILIDAFQFPIRNSVRSDSSAGRRAIPHSLFQFPIRNSVRSDSAVRATVSATINSFNSPFGILFVRTSTDGRIGSELAVSIPHSEFCSIGLEGLARVCAHLLRFQFPIRNSVRSDGGQAGAREGGCASFQFPIRNSVRSDQSSGARELAGLAEFQFPIRNSVRSDDARRPIWTRSRLFQFPIRNSVRSDTLMRSGTRRNVNWFQFPIRNSVRSDPYALARVCLAKA